ncbi:MAG: NYN domain protein [Tenericutes bacterium ADurb.Bin087]|nr:MAG: NYN domain protein [Tenericutes bacterium ADurb.Bin087]
MAEKNLALLIDAENISPDYMSIIRDEANKYGNLSYKRIYGDWASSNLNKWRSKCIEYNLEQIQQVSYVSGKSTSDFTLVIDAMDILYTDQVDGFVLVSSDSDFTRLVSRLRQNNKFIIGMGESKTPLSLVNSVDLFIYLDKIKNIRDKNVKPKHRGRPASNKKDEEGIISLEDLIDVLTNIISETGDENGWAYWSNTNNTLVRKYPGFDPRNYGFKGKALQFFLANGFEKRNEGLDVFIRPKTNNE